MRRFKFKRERRKSNRLSRVIIAMTSTQDSNWEEKRESFHKSQIPQICLSPTSLRLLSSVFDLFSQIQHQVHHPCSEIVGASGKVRGTNSAPGQPWILIPCQRFAASRTRLMNIWRGMVSDCRRTSRWSGTLPRLTI